MFLLEHSPEHKSIILKLHFYEDGQADGNRSDDIEGKTFVCNLQFCRWAGSCEEEEADIPCFYGTNMTNAAIAEVQTISAYFEPSR